MRITDGSRLLLLLHRRVGRSVDVLDQFARSPRIPEARVHGDVRIDAELAAEGEKLVGAYILGLHGMHTGSKIGGRFSMSSTPYRHS
jgi:hypothetical protein